LNRDGLISANKRTTGVRFMKEGEGQNFPFHIHVQNGSLIHLVSYSFTVDEDGRNVALPI